MKNEKTSARVATIAGWWFNVLREEPMADHAWISAPRKPTKSNPMKFRMVCIGTVAELKALAASVLTQAPDKPKRNGKR